MTTSYPFLRLTKNGILLNSTTELDIPARGDRQSPSRRRRRPNPDPTMFLHSNDARQGLRPRSHYSHPPSSLLPENTHHAYSQPKFAVPDLVVNIDFRFRYSSCQSKQSDPSDLANTFFSTSRIIHQESDIKSSRI
ncbi:hypothetical protein L1887_34551 [Cichorium endivia]|nr:hypothetical protein L1887_34551 [Cichorium endivia]